MRPQPCIDQRARRAIGDVVGVVCRGGVARPIVCERLAPQTQAIGWTRYGWKIGIYPEDRRHERVVDERVRDVNRLQTV
jgi:hypothetical protein